MEGYGFESNNSMTDFRVRNVSAILPVQQFTPGDPSPAASDSVSAPASVATDSATVRYRPSDRRRKGAGSGIRPTGSGKSRGCARHRTTTP